MIRSPEMSGSSCNRLSTQLTVLQISLLEYLDLSQLNCLNESSAHTFKSIVSLKSRNTSGSFLLSDADEQLLLNIPVGVLDMDLWYRSMAHWE
jgi:hypothetical protein